jgi:hypothetical protein
LRGQWGGSGGLGGSGRRFCARKGGLAMFLECRDGDVFWGLLVLSFSGYDRALIRKWLCIITDQKGYSLTEEWRTGEP